MNRHSQKIANYAISKRVVCLLRSDLSLANCGELHDSALDSLAHTIRRLQHATPDPDEADDDAAVPAHDADLEAALLASRLSASRFFVEVRGMRSCNLSPDTSLKTFFLFLLRV